jgi:hypothetical protein
MSNPMGDLIAHIPRSLMLLKGRSWEAANKTRKEFKESTSLPKPTELPKSWVKIFDSLKSLLCSRRGDASKVCLLYLIRDDETPVDADLAPGPSHQLRNVGGRAHRPLSALGEGRQWHYRAPPVLRA